MSERVNSFVLFPLVSTMIRNDEFGRKLWPLSGNKLKICNLLRFFDSSTSACCCCFSLLWLYLLLLCFLCGSRILISFSLLYAHVKLHLVRLQAWYYLRIAPDFCSLSYLLIWLWTFSVNLCWLHCFVLFVDVNQIENHMAGWKRGRIQ